MTMALDAFNPFNLKAPSGKKVLTLAQMIRALFTNNEKGVWYDPSDLTAEKIAFRRNLLTWTENFSNAAWSVTNGSKSGTNEVTFTSTFSGSNLRQYVTAAVPAGTVVSGKIRIKGVPGNVIILRIGGNNSLSSALSITLTGTYTEYTVTHTISVTSTTFEYQITNSSVAPNTFQIESAQLELGSTTTAYQKITDFNTEFLAAFPSHALYQDSVGTTAVTAAGQPVGLMLDKSKGLVLGSEVFIDPSVASLVNFVAEGVPTTLELNGDGNLHIVASANNTGAKTTISGFAPSSKTFLFEFEIYVLSGTVKLTVDYSSSKIVTVSANGGFQKKQFISPGGTTLYYVGTGAGTIEFIIRNISVKELPGYHATQATSTARPILARHPITGRRNLLTYTEDFGNAAWNKGVVTVTADAATAPDGTTTADKVIPQASSNNHYLLSGSFGSLSQATYRLKVKAAGYTKFALRESQTTGAYASFDLSSGTVIETGIAGTITSVVATITADVNGYYLVTATFTGTTVYGFGFWALPDSYTTGQPASVLWTGDNISGYYIWGAQVEASAAPTAYQKVTSTYDVTESGVADAYHLKFDGVDDLLTTSIPGLSLPLSRVSAFTQNSYTSFDQIFGDTTIAFAAGLAQWSPEPQLAMHSGTGLNMTPNLPVQTRGVIYEKYDGAASEGQLNRNSVFTGNAGTTAPAGLTLGGSGAVMWNSHCDIYGVVEINRALTASEKTMLQDFMAGKSGVTL